MNTIIDSAHVLKNILPANTIYIDAGSKWSNPYVVGLHGTHEEVTDLYSLKLARDYKLLREIDELQGMSLMTCQPTAGYAQVLLSLASIDYEERKTWAETIKAALYREAA